MKLEHFALNVSDPLAMTNWYTKHLGLTIVRQKTEPPFTTFLGDDSGQILLEIYNNPVNEVPSYSEMNPLLLHLALVFFAHPATCMGFCQQLVQKLQI